MGVTIERVAATDIARFVELPFSLYANNKFWIPPLRRQERDLLTPGRHPFWETASRELFLAKRDGRPVGRIAAIVDEKYNSFAHERCGAFGFFECENDREAAFALLNAASQWLTAAGMTFMRGPLNPSTNYTCGLLVAGFDLPPAIMMPWNPPWYAELLESWKMHKEEDLFAYTLKRGEAGMAAGLGDEIARLSVEGKFTCRSSSRKTLAGDIRTMLDIYRRSWADNWGFSPLSEAEANRHVAELKSVLDPDFFVLFFHGDDPAAGMVALPDLNPLLKRLNGSLGLLTPWHYWRSKADIARGIRIMLFGILPQYRLFGLPLLLFDRMLELSGKRAGLEWVEGSWVLENNAAIDDLIEDFGGKISKRYRIYRREIGPC